MKSNDLIAKVPTKLISKAVGVEEKVAEKCLSRRCYQIAISTYDVFKRRRKR
jgi:hypothetical protein